MKPVLVTLLIESQALADKVKALRQKAATTPPEGIADRGEFMANLTLAQRSIEGGTDKITRVLSEFPD